MSKDPRMAAHMGAASELAKIISAKRKKKATAGEVPPSEKDALMARVPADEPPSSDNVEYEPDKDETPDMGDGSGAEQYDPAKRLFDARSGNAIKKHPSKVVYGKPRGMSQPPTKQHLKPTLLSKKK